MGAKNQNSARVGVSGQSPWPLVQSHDQFSPVGDGLGRRLSTPPRRSPTALRPPTFRIFVLSLISLMVLVNVVYAHAILVRSIPRAHEVIAGGELNILLEFNSRIDAARSNLILVLPGEKTKEVVLLPQPSASSLAAKTGALGTGSHVIRWQVLANDGHITRGEIPFDVK